jgi:hypothetical protein
MFDQEFVFLLGESEVIVLEELTEHLDHRIVFLLETVLQRSYEIWEVLKSLFKKYLCHLGKRFCSRVYSTMNLKKQGRFGK